jgi:hypothetical protein
LRTFSQHGRTALETIRRYGFSRAKGLEFELLSAHRELSALRDDYLELGVQASKLAGKRDLAIVARKKTETYIAFIHPDREVEGESGRRAPADPGRGRHTQQVAQSGIGDGNGQSENTSTGENGGKANGKQRAGWNVLDALKEYFTPLPLLLEAEISSVQRELASLGDDYLELADRANTIGSECDTALIELNKAQVFAERLMPGLGVKHQNGDRTSDPISEDYTDRLAAVREKLARTQAEKNDVSIKLAESEDQVAELRLQETQRDKELDTLKQRLSGSDKDAAVAFQKAQQLTDEIEKAHIVADEKNKFLDGELRRARNEYAEIRRNDRHHIEVLRRRVAELEPTLAAAKRTIESIKQAQADASYRQKVLGRHTALLASELDEKSRQHKESLNTTQHRMKPASAETAMADRQASHISWTRIAAGFVFLLGVLASVAKIWDIDSQMIHLAGGGKEVDVGTGEWNDADQRGAGQASLSLPETIAFASLDTAEILPTKVESESEKAEAGEDKTENKEQILAPQLKDSKIENIRNRNAKRKRTTGWNRGRGGLVRAYLMEGNDDIDISYDTCLQGGGDAKECAFLEKNMFEEGVVRLPSGVQYTVIRNGTGASPGLNDIVLVDFRGMLLDGTEFDSSRSHGGASSFRVDEAIPGLQNVLQHMEEGAKWEVYIPTELAFKKPAVFGGQTVFFELELISIEGSQTLRGESGATRVE